MEICVQTGGVFDAWGYETGAKMIRDAGFTGVDWNVNTAWNRAALKKGIKDHCVFEDDTLEEARAYFAPQLEALRKYGLSIRQAHAPFPAYIEGQPWFNEYAIQVTKNCIRYCDSVGVKYVVVHGISRALTDKSQTPETIRRMNYHLYESLLPVLENSDIVVCMENLFTHNDKQIIEGVCSNPAEAIEYIDTMNAKAGREAFALCLDTGHLNLLGKAQDDYIRALGKRIKALHIHDNDGHTDEHLAPYTGNILWKDFMQGLKDVGYAEDLSFETFKQVTLKRIDAPMVPIWLKAIHDMGQEFKNFIEG